MNKELQDSNNQTFDRILAMNTKAERRQIAAMAMQGLLANSNSPYGRYEEIAQFAVAHADALIVELKKTEK